jgi:hypothetical protein
MLEKGNWDLKQQATKRGLNRNKYRGEEKLNIRKAIHIQLLFRYHEIVSKELNA